MSPVDANQRKIPAPMVCVWHFPRRSVKINQAYWGLGLGLADGSPLEGEDGGPAKKCCCHEERGGGKKTPNDATRGQVRGK